MRVLFIYLMDFGKPSQKTSESYIKVRHFKIDLNFFYNFFILYDKYEINFIH